MGPASPSRVRFWDVRAGGVVVAGGRDGGSLIATEMRCAEGVTSEEEGELDKDGAGIWVARFATLTGLRMQRLTCRFKLDATPKRRPQVSHTNAERG